MKKIFYSTIFMVVLSYFSNAQSIYNYKGSGALNALTSWTLSPGGTNPTDFISPNQIFVITNISGITMTGTSWTVSGSGSEIRVGNGSSPTQLSISTTGTLIVNGGAKLRVQNNGTLTLIQTNMSALPSATDVIIDNGSTVNWTQNASVPIWPLNYWNLGFGTYIKNIAASTSATVQNIFNPNNVTLDLNNNSAFTILGNVNGNMGLRSAVSTCSIIIKGSGTSSVNINLPTNDQTFGYFELSRNSLVKWNKSAGTYVFFAQGASVSTGTVDLTGISSGQSIYIRGNTTLGTIWRTNSGNLLRIDGSGTVSGNLQFDSGANNLYALIFSRSSQTLNLTTPLNIYNNLYVMAGTFNSNGNLTIKSTATQKGRIDVLGTGADVTGNVKVETFAKGGYTGWTNLAVAGVSGQTMASGWGDNFPMTCPSGCPNGSTAGGSPFTSVTKYDETTDTYPGISSGSDPITPGVGYWVYLGNGQPTTSDILIDVTGPIVKKNAGSWNFTKTSGKGEGWNLVGNPYPSTISFSKTFSSSYGSGKMANELRVWNPDLNSGSGDYALYKVGVGSTPPVSSGGVDDNIPTGQGFYIIANSNFSLSWNENFKTTTPSNNPLLRLMTNNAPEPNRLFYLHLTGTSGADSYCGIHFNNNASLLYDPTYDAQNIEPYPGAPQIFIQTGSNNLKLKGVPYPNGLANIDVQFSCSTAGVYQISLDGIQNIPSGACISITDHLTNITHNLLTSAYTFTHTSNTATPRFSLNIQLNNLNTSVLSLNTQNPQCHKDNTGSITADMGSGNYNFTWKDANNQILKSTIGINRDTLKNVSEAWYFVEISDGNCAHLTQAIQLSANIGTGVADFSINSDTLPTNVPFIFTNTSQNLTAFTWYFGDGGSSTAINPTHTYTQPGNYVVQLYGFNSCGDTVSTFKEISVTTVTGINPNGVPVSPMLWISRDNNGYYINSNYTQNTNVNILVSDVLGRTYIQKTIILGDDKKFYLNNIPSNQILVIRADDGYNFINKKIWIE